MFWEIIYILNTSLFAFAYINIVSRPTSFPMYIVNILISIVFGFVITPVVIGNAIATTYLKNCKINGIPHKKD